MSSLAWPGAVRAKFLRHKAKRMPEVSYPELPDFDPTLRELDAIREEAGETTAIDRWLGGTAETLIRATRLLQARGTPAFYDYSRELYGAPTDQLSDGASTSLQLAETFTNVLDDLDHVELGLPEPDRRTARGVASALRRASRELFGEAAPEVEVVDELSANALAGPNRIRVRRGARFSQRDVHQLIHHEVYIHVATALNGRAQEALPILASSHPGTTRTQEGLAVFAEFISGSMELGRLRRLTDRVLGIQMAREGADFMEIYRYFRQRGNLRVQAFESARRIFRGGVLTGGAPFTKDIVYLDGLLRVHNFLRVAVAMGRADCLRLMFCGKFALDDMPAICELTASGLIRKPAYLPPWAQDLRFLLAYLAYSGFLNRIRLDKVRAHFAAILDEAPVVDAET